MAEVRLSLLVPSKRPDGLEALLQSLERHSVTGAVEVVVLVDDPVDYVEFHHRQTVIHLPPQVPVSIAALLHECYARSTGEWIMFGNDDIVCDTPSWDRLVFDAIDQYGQDGLALFWPDDHMFQARLACFPIVSRAFLELVGFFPQPYQRYKVDDTIHALIPPDRRHFLSHVHFPHSNDHGETGFPLGDGRIYPVIQESAVCDNAVWQSEADRRSRMQMMVNHAISRLE